MITLAHNESGGASERVPLSFREKAMAIKHFYYTVSMTASYMVDVPDDKNPWDVIHGLAHNDDFFVHQIAPDLNDADWSDVECDMDDWTDGDYVDVTQEQVRKYMGKEA